MAMDGLLFDEEELIPWKAEWQNMPEYSHQDLAPKYQVIVNFSCEADVSDFGLLVGIQNLKPSSRQLKSIWYPDQELGRMVNKRYIDCERR